MAAKSKNVIKVALKSTESHHIRTTRRNKKSPKLEGLKKFDPVIRGPAVYKEIKLK